MEAALTAVADPVAWTDPGGKVEWCNVAFDRLAGRMHGDVVGANLIEMLPLEQNGARVVGKDHPVQLALEGEHGWEGCYEIGLGAHRRVLDISASPLQVGEDRRSVVVVMRDITHRMHAEELFHRESTFVRLLQATAVASAEAASVEEALQATLDEVCRSTDWPVGHVYLTSGATDSVLAPTAIWHLREPARFEEFRRITELTRFAPGVDLPGRVYTTGQAVWIRDVTRDPGFHRAKLAEEIGVRAGFGFPVRAGSTVAAVLEFFSPEVMERDEVFLQVMSHVGTQLGRVIERRRADEELRKATARLERSNREFANFADVATRDLQEPVRRIQAFGERLRSERADALDERSRDDLERMQSGASRMSRLVDDLLAFSRIATGEESFAPVSLAEVAFEVLSDLGTRIEQAGGSIQLGDLPTIDADRGQMQQLVFHLIDNALKFHRPDVPPVIRVHARRVPNPDPGGGSPSAELCVLLVEDEGTGFDERYVDRIFDLFQRLHGRTEYEGTGIGLAVCRRIVERHHGAITARSRPGQGSTFIVTLPVKQEKRNERMTDGESD